MEKIDVMALDGRQIRLLMAIFETQSVSAAAARFELNQSTASHHLDRMRRILGDPLFVKVGRGITPTDHMRSIVPTLRTLVAGLEGLSQQRRFDPAQETEPFTIAANTAEVVPQMLSLRSRVRQRAPFAPLRFLELGSRARILSLLEESRADVILTIQLPRYEATLNATEFSQDPHVVFYDPAVRGPVRSAADYAAAPHAALDFGGPSKSTVARALDDAGLSREIVIAAPDVFMLGQLISGTDMIATMQASLAASVLSHLAWCPAPIVLPPVRQDLVWHKRVQDSARNVWFRDQVLATRKPCQATR